MLTFAKNYGILTISGWHTVPEPVRNFNKEAIYAGRTEN